MLVACVGGGSINAIGLFYPFLQDEGVAIYGVEAAGMVSKRDIMPLYCAVGTIIHSNHAYLLSDDDGQIIETHSISARLDYPGVGPEHAWLKSIGRAHYVAVTDKEALAAFHDLTRIEGIIPALESSHALAYVKKLAPTLGRDKTIVVNLSGRGDKDIHTVAHLEGIKV
ncbi:MAG: pyridoxal-phosphate dependent enzyme [Thiotrichaceae bacterium]